MGILLCFLILFFISIGILIYLRYMREITKTKFDDEEIFSDNQEIKKILDRKSSKF